MATGIYQNRSNELMKIALKFILLAQDGTELEEKSLLKMVPRKLKTTALCEMFCIHLFVIN
jgi:hypothetical protein